MVLSSIAVASTCAIQQIVLDNHHKRTRDVMVTKEICEMATRRVVSTTPSNRLKLRLLDTQTEKNFEPLGVCPIRRGWNIGSRKIMKKKVPSSGNIYSSFEVWNKGGIWFEPVNLSENESQYRIQDCGMTLSSDDSLRNSKIDENSIRGCRLMNHRLSLSLKI